MCAEIDNHVSRRQKCKREAFPEKKIHLAYLQFNFFLLFGMSVELCVVGVAFPELAVGLIPSRSSVTYPTSSSPLTVKYKMT